MFMFNQKLISLEGTENGWKWIKYPDGKAICYGSFTKSIVVTSQWGNQYTGVFGNLAFPTNLFIDTPTPFVNVITGFSCWLMPSGDVISKTNTGGIACVRPSSITQSSSITISYFAIGRWKN